MPPRKHATNQIERAVRDVRLASRLTQEDFALVSSRTYLSTIERGIQQPTLAKLDALSEVMDLHPLSLLTLSYLERRNTNALRGLLGRVESELKALGLLADGDASPSKPIGSRTRR